MDVRAKTRRFLDHRRKLGTVRAANVVLGGILNRLGVSINYVYVGPAEKDPLKAGPPEVPLGYETRAGTLQDFVHFAEQGHDYDLFAIERQLAYGDLCAVTVFEGELVGYRFVTTARAPVTEQLFTVIPDGFRYAYKAWIHADHRRKNLDSKAVWVLKQMEPAGHRQRNIWDVACNNYASLLHGYVNPRYRSMRVGVVGWVTLFGKQWPFASRGAKWVGFDFRRDGANERQYL